MLNNTLNMRFIYFLLFILNINGFIQGKNLIRGFSVNGEYTVELKLLNLDNQPLQNYMVIFECDTFFTNRDGVVIFSVKWQCFYEKYKKRYFKKRNNFLNGKYLQIVFSNKEKIFIRNKWRKYGLNCKQKNCVYKKTIKIPQTSKIKI